MRTTMRLSTYVRAAALAALLAYASLVSTPASAAVIHTHPFIQSFDGAGSVGTGGPTGPFGQLGELAFDQSSHSLYALDHQYGTVIDKFDASGNPQPFSGLGPGITSLGGSWCNYYIPSITVDNSGAATAGRIYFASACEEKVYAFGPDGSELTGNFPLSMYLPCGTGVDPDGSLRVNRFFAEMHRYDATGADLNQSFDSGAGSCAMAIDPSEPPDPLSGQIYVGFNFAGQPNIGVYDPNGNFIRTLTTTSFVTALAVDPSTQNLYAVESDEQSGDVVNEFDSSGNLVGTFGRISVGHGFDGLCKGAAGIAVDDETHRIYVADCNRVSVFGPGEPEIFPNVVTEAANTQTNSATLRGHVDPDGGGDTVSCVFEWDIDTSYAHKTPCVPAGPLHNADGNTAVSANIPNLTEGESYHYRLVASNANGPVFGADLTFRAQEKPGVSQLRVRDVKSDAAQLIGTLDPRGGDTTYHFELGTDTSYGTVTPAVDGTLRSPIEPEIVSARVEGLAPNTTYHYRIVAENGAGTLESPDQVFKTYNTAEESIDTCPNAQARSQTGSSSLPDCRGYELASAPNAGGYDVQSDLVPGQQVLPAYPDASDRVLYSLHYGKIPGVAGEPTNFGLDPYVAVRGSGGWTTHYVGIPANSAPASPRFGSPLAAADSSLNTFVFGGSTICQPCFPDGKTGIPVRLPDGALVQGMAGTNDPGPLATQGGYVGKQLSANGEHLVFGSTSKFENDGNSSEVSIYDRNLETGVTQVVSKTTAGATMTGPGIGELDISSDGSRIVIGKMISTDGAGNRYWHLYMHVGSSSHTIDLTPGATSGVLLDGMTSDGTKVFVSTLDSLLAADSDHSADIYEADIAESGSVTLSLISKGSSAGNSDSCTPTPSAEAVHWNSVSGSADCSVAAFAGGAGVAANDGTIYFLSPEKLDGAGAENAPNLFVARPSHAPQFVTTLNGDDSSVAHAVYESSLTTRGDIQVTPSGEDAVFDSISPITSFPSFGFSEIYRYHPATANLVCVSCGATNAAATGDTTLSEAGLNLSDDGRVFFTTPDQLVLRDTGGKKDAYEWTDGAVELLSTGTSISDSGLVTVSRDGRDAYFYTRKAIVPEDANGSALKIYDARVEGGVTFDPPHVPCQASDECHGPGTVTPPPPPIGTYKGTGGNVTSHKKRHRPRHHKNRKHHSRGGRRNG